jgi:hypothetical protein
MASDSKLFIRFVVLALLTVVNTNCSKVDQANLAPQAEFDSFLINPNSGISEGIDFDEFPGDPGDLKTRLVSFPINSTQIPANNKVKLLIVVDNSKSMRFVHEKLSKSLDSLIKPLKDFQIEIKIITTSEIMRQSGEELENQGFSYRSWTYPIGSKPNAEETRILNAKPSETFGIYSYGEYHFLNDRYRIKFEPGDSQLNAKLSDLKKMILDISKNTNGTNREQGLCNLLLALQDRGPHQFFEKNDTAGVLVISDENDQSFWNRYDTTENRVSCRNTYIHGNLEDKTIDEEVVDDSVNFNIFSARYQIAFDYNNDGLIERRNRGDNGGNPLPYSTYSSLMKDLIEKTTLACPQDFYNNVILGYANYLASASGGKNALVTDCRVTPTWSAFYGFAPTADNVCVGSFTKNGKSYASFEEYLRLEKNMILVPGSCRHSKSKRSPHRGFGSFFLAGSEDSETNRELIRDAKISQSSIKKAILNQAQLLFGKEKFFMGSLIHKDTSCISDSNIQSVGADYANLFQGTIFSGRSVSESICSEDYSPILKDLSGGIATSVNRTYKVDDYKPYETLYRVFIVRNGIKTQLGISNYTLNEDTVTLGASVVLNSGDILEVEIVSAD